MELNTNKNNQFNNDSLEVFPYKSLKETLEILNCSRYFFYSLVRKKKIKAYYFEVDNSGKGKGKPYFNLQEIAQSFITAGK